MASKRRIRRHACTGKRQYDNQQQASEAARDMGYKYGERGLLPYRCAFCSTQGHPRFHIGHSTIRRDAA